MTYLTCLSSYAKRCWQACKEGLHRGTQCESNLAQLTLSKKCRCALASRAGRPAQAARLGDACAAYPRHLQPLPARETRGSSFVDELVRAMAATQTSSSATSSTATAAGWGRLMSAIAHRTPNARPRVRAQSRAGGAAAVSRASGRARTPDPGGDGAHRSRTAARGRSAGRGARRARLSGTLRRAPAAARQRVGRRGFTIKGRRRGEEETWEAQVVLTALAAAGGQGPARAGRSAKARRRLVSNGPSRPRRPRPSPEALLRDPRGGWKRRRKP